MHGLPTQEVQINQLYYLFTGLTLRDGITQIGQGGGTKCVSVRSVKLVTYSLFLVPLIFNGDNGAGHQSHFNLPTGEPRSSSNVDYTE